MINSDSAFIFLNSSIKIAYTECCFQVIRRHGESYCILLAIQSDEFCPIPLYILNLLFYPKSKIGTPRS
jgi:hypothetical protein